MTLDVDVAGAVEPVERADFGGSKSASCPRLRYGWKAGTRRRNYLRL